MPFAPTFVLFYISGHGFGHARRMTQVIRELLRLRPDISIRIRTAAPARVLDPLPAEWISTCEIDAGLVERDALTIDRTASLERLLTFMARREQIIRDEVAALADFRLALVVADIPFLAGDVASLLGVPCVGISNFTWDWIYQNLFCDDPRYAAIDRSIVQSHRGFSTLLELPFGRTSAAISSKIQMPLVAMRSSRSRDDILRQLNIPPHDHRPRVLIGTRGGLPADTLSRAAQDAPTFLFLCPHVDPAALPENAVSVTLSPSLDFSDVLAVSDIVISKLGYGMISECIATQTRLLWPRRMGFAEDSIVETEAPAYVPMLELPADAYRTGTWRTALGAAMNLPPASQTIRIDGASACAQLLAGDIR
jgi:L-arabinokinase